MDRTGTLSVQGEASNRLEAVVAPSSISHGTEAAFCRGLPPQETAVVDAKEDVESRVSLPCLSTSSTTAIQGGVQSHPFGGRSPGYVQSSRRVHGLQYLQGHLHFMGFQVHLL